MKKIDKNEQYTEDFLKWQNNQYNPGAYVGGNFPMDAKHGGNKNRVILLIQSLLLLFGGLAIIIGAGTESKVFGYIIFFLGLIISFGLIWRLYYKKKQH